MLGLLHKAAGPPHPPPAGTRSRASHSFHSSRSGSGPGRCSGAQEQRAGAPNSPLLLGACFTGWKGAGCASQGAAGGMFALQAVQLGLDQTGSGDPGRLCIKTVLEWLDIALPCLASWARQGWKDFYLCLFFAFTLQSPIQNKSLPLSKHKRVAVVSHSAPGWSETVQKASKQTHGAENN